MNDSVDLVTEPLLRPQPFEDVVVWRANPYGPRHPEQATSEEFARAVTRLGGSGSWTAVAALRLLERAEAAEAAISDAAAREQELVAAHKEQVTRLLEQQAASLKWERERDEARKEIEWLKRAWATCRRVICEMADVQAAREELADATRRLSAAQAERHEAEREPNDQW